MRSGLRQCSACSPAVSSAEDGPVFDATNWLVETYFKVLAKRDKNPDGTGRGGCVPDPLESGCFDAKNCRFGERGEVVESAKLSLRLPTDVGPSHVDHCPLRSR